MALKVLLADSNDEWLESAVKYMKEQLYEVGSVTNGKDVQLALYNEKYFAVLMNFDIKNHSGAQVLKFIKTNYPSQRVILILENEEKLESSGLTSDGISKMGSVEIAVKPFEMSHLKELLEGHQSLGDLISNLPKKEGQSAEEEVDQNDDMFTSIRIGDFYSSKAVLFDVYIQLRSNRYVKILHAGDTFSKERIDKYKNEKKVEFLYFHNSDRRKFIQYNNFVAQKLIRNEIVPAESKMKVLKNVADKYVEEAFTEGMKPQIIDQGKEVCQNIYEFVEKQDDLFKLLRGYQDFDPSAFTHAFLVSVFCTSIIKQFEWQSKTTIEATALACLFHDIGKMKLPKELMDLRPQEMDDEQMEVYKTHPELGVEIVEGNRMINNSVKQIILQHHEAFDGTGYPYGKKGSNILTLANIVSLCDDFVHIMVDEDLKPVEALKKLLVNPEQVAKYNSIIVENFIKVFTDPSKIMKEVQSVAPGTPVANKKAS